MSSITIYMCEQLIIMSAFNFQFILIPVLYSVAFTDLHMGDPEESCQQSTQCSRRTLREGR